MHKQVEEFVTLEGIIAAHERITKSTFFRTTPIARNAERVSPKLVACGAKEVAIKLESLQIGGCFKTRGILNMLEKMPEEKVKKTGLITMSAGNFGRCFALLCSKRGLSATVLMPETVPKDRVEVISGLGAEVKLVPRIELQQRVDEAVASRGLIYAHPFDDLALIEGYGGIGLELMELHPDIVVVGVGGGGLISGIATALKLESERIGHNVRIIGVEPEGAPKMFESLKAGRPITLERISTIAHGLAAPYAGTITFRHVQKFVDEVVLVSDDQIREAMLMLYNEHKVVVEAAGAAAVAAVMCGAIRDLAGKRVICVVSGGNVTLQEFVNVTAQQS